MLRQLMMDRDSSQRISLLEAEFPISNIPIYYFLAIELERLCDHQYMGDVCDCMSLVYRCIDDSSDSARKCMQPIVGYTRLILYRTRRAH